MATIFVACGDDGTTETERLAVLNQRNELELDVTVPATATAGQPFEVLMVTQGGGCIAQGRDEVQVAGLRVDIWPYDIHIDPGPGSDCPSILLFYDHRPQVTIESTGTATVAIHHRIGELEAVDIYPVAVQ